MAMKKQKQNAIVNGYAHRLSVKMRAHRSIRDLSQDGLARKVGCCQATINQIEKGKKLPGFETLIKLARAMKVTPAQLFMRDA